MSETTARPSGIAKASFAVAIGLLLLLPLSVLGVRLGIWHYSIGLMLCAISLAGSFMLQIILAIWLLRKPAIATKRQLRKTSLAALPPLLVAAVIIRQSGDKPMIHDITTDTQQPPEFSFLIDVRGEDSNDLSIKPEVISAQRKAYPQIKPLASNLSAEQALNQAISTCQEMGWQIQQVNRKMGKIEASSTTRWFAFVDDIVIRVKPSPDGNGSVIDLRSVSRVGEGDLGANARRIEAFIKAFQDSSNN